MADENDQRAPEEQETPEAPQPVPDEPVVEEQPAAPESPAEAPEEPRAEEPAAPAPPVEASEEAPAEEPAAPEAPVEASEEAPAEEPAAAAPPAADAAAEEAQPKKKKKRLPRAQRRQRSKPKREVLGERKPIVRLPKPEHERGRRQERRGVVVSSAMDKTIVVKVDTVKADPRYKKVVRHSRKFQAHDEGNAANVGDVVRIVETRPLSKNKNWRLAEVVEAAR